DRGRRGASRTGQDQVMIRGGASLRCPDAGFFCPCCPESRPFGVVFLVATPEGPSRERPLPGPPGVEDEQRSSEFFWSFLFGNQMPQGGRPRRCRRGPSPRIVPAPAPATGAPVKRRDRGEGVPAHAPEWPVGRSPTRPPDRIVSGLREEAAPHPPLRHQHH